MCRRERNEKKISKIEKSIKSVVKDNKEFQEKIIDMNKKEIEKTEGRLNDKLNKIAINITENIKEAQSTYNEGLKVAGILLTRYTGRATLSKQLREAFIEPAETLNTKVYKEPIREGIAVKEAHIMQQSIFDYEPKSNPALDYMAFIEEYLKDHKKK